jgi:hypothetical protein
MYRSMLGLAFAILNVCLQRVFKGEKAELIEWRHSRGPRCRLVCR